MKDFFSPRRVLKRNLFKNYFSWINFFILKA